MSKVLEVKIDDDKGEEQIDTIEFCFHINANEYALFGHEYRPIYRTDYKCKAADFTVLLINEEESRFVAMILEDKLSVKDEEVVFTILDQMKSSWDHIADILAIMSDYQENITFGCITRNYDVDYLCSAISNKESKIKEINNILSNIGLPQKLFGEKEIEVIKLKRECDLLHRFIEGTIKLQGEIYPINMYKAQLTGRNSAFCSICISSDQE